VKRNLALALVVATALLVLACGGDGAVEVKVSLKEWSIELTDGRSEIEAGDVRVIARNGGTKPHQLVVIKSDLPPQELSVVDGKVDEERVNIIGEIEPFAAGETARATLQLSPGKYLLICNVVEVLPGESPEGHYRNGMVAPLFVTD